MNGQWQKYDVKESSPSKATAYINWAPEPWSLRVQSTTSFDVSDAEGNDINGYTTVDFISSWQLPVETLSFSVENLFDRDYTTVWGQRAPLGPQPGLRPCFTVRLQRPGPNLWSELLSAVLTWMLLQQGYAETTWSLVAMLFTASIIYSLTRYSVSGMDCSPLNNIMSVLWID